MYDIPSPERLYIYAFHMPFFFFVSGLFFKPKTIIEEIQKSVNRLIIPAFIYILLSWLIQVPFIDKTSAYEMAKDSVLAIIQSGQIKANNITWFFFALANVRILASIWNNKKYILIITILIISLLTITRHNLFFLGQSVIALPFYLLGYYSRNLISKEATINRGWSRLVISIILLLFTIILTTINGRSDVLGFRFGHMPYGLNFIAFYLNAIIGTLLILNTSLLFNKQSAIINKTSSALMTIVGLQRIPLNLFYMQFGVNPSYIFSIPGTIIIMYICMIFHKPISKILPNKQ